MSTKIEPYGTLAGGLLRTALNATGAGALFDDGSDWLTLVNAKAARLLKLRQQSTGDAVSLHQIAWSFQDAQGVIVWSTNRKERPNGPAEPGSFLTRDGRRLEVALSPMDRGEGWVWTLRDITRQSDREAELEAARQEAEAAKAQAQAASQAKSEFLATISHELRTPMNAIIGMTDLVMDSELNSDQVSLLRTVQSSSHGLLAIVNDVLDLSKIETGNLEVRDELFSIHDVVEGVANGLAPRAFDKGLELTTEIAADMPQALDGDGHRLRQILVNLLGNAVKFTEKGSVCLRCKVVDEQAGEVTVLLSVRDTGIGVSPGDLEHVFDPFFRAEDGSAQTREGTGLGLGITRRLADLMGGTISAWSEPGEGSVFHVTLPFRRSAKALPQRRSSDRRYPDVHVMVVSPSSEVRRSALRAAAYLGTHRVMARNVTQAEGLVELCAVHGHLTVLVDHALGRAELERLAAAVAAASPGRSITMAPLVPPGARPALRVPPDLELNYVSKPLTRRGLASTFPASRELAQAAGGSRADTADRSGQRVLLVESDGDHRDHARRLLEGVGMIVESTEEGSRGVEMYRARAYDLVITDLEMPGLDGFGVLDSIRQIEAEAGRTRVPIVATTAHAARGYAEHCRATGMDAYLTKPLREDDLLQTVDRLIQPGPVVLVVDDDPSSRELLRRILTREGYRMESAGTAVEALRRIEIGGIGTVLLDWTLPDMDGGELAHAIRNMPGLADLSLVAVTGHVGSEAETRCMNAGCDAYLAKPIRRETILATLSFVRGETTEMPSPIEPPAASVSSDRPRARVPADIADLATIYLGDRLSEIGVFQDCLARRDTAGISALARNIAGSASCFGFDELGTVARRLVAACHDGRWDETCKLVGDVWSYLSNLEWDVIAD